LLGTDGGYPFIDGGLSTKNFRRRLGAASGLEELSRKGENYVQDAGKQRMAFSRGYLGYFHPGLLSERQVRPF